MSDARRQIFEEMSVENLEELIQNNLAVSEPQYDGDALLIMMEVLRDKKRQNNSEETYDINSMWNRFCEDYLPKADEDIAAVKEFSEEHSDGSLPSVSAEMPKRRRRNFGTIFRAASIALVAVALLVSIISTTAYAKGFDLWGIVARWTAEQFDFVKADTNEIPRTADYVGEYKTLEEALISHGINEPLAPSWLPEGYALNRLTEDGNNKRLCFSAEYVNAEMQIINISIAEHKEDTDTFVIHEKDAGSVEVYSIDGITHNIMSNLNQSIITWISGNYECTIRGNFSADSAYMIIDSIYER